MRHSGSRSTTVATSSSGAMNGGNDDDGSEWNACRGGTLTVLTASGNEAGRVALPDATAWGYGSDPIVLSGNGQIAYVVDRVAGVHAVDLVTGHTCRLLRRRRVGGYGIAGNRPRRARRGTSLRRLQPRRVSSVSIQADLKVGLYLATPLLRYPATSQWRKQGRNRLLDLFRRVRRRIPRDDLSARVHQELREVPLDALGAEHAAPGALELFVERMRAGPFTSTLANSGNVTS